MSKVADAMRKTHPFRLAFRVEGDRWNAYLAKRDTMDEAIWLGSIFMGAVVNEAVKDDFMKLMQEAMSNVVEAAFDVRPVWDGPPQGAPEHERSGTA